MSNYTMTLKHKITGEMHQVIALDNHLGNRIYGYKLPGDYIVNKDTLEKLYYLNDYYSNHII